MQTPDARHHAIQYYDTSIRTLEADLSELIASARGVFVFTPQLTVLMKAIDLTDEESITNLRKHNRRINAWYVHFLSGDLSLAFEWARSLPPLPYLCFQRGIRSPKLHLLPWSRLPFATDNNKASKKSVN